MDSRSVCSSHSDVSRDDWAVRRSTEKEQEREQQSGIATKETSTVLRLRLAVFAVLVVSAVGAAILIYSYARNNEQAKLAARFESDAQKVVDAIASSVQKSLVAFDSLASAMVSHAESSNTSWPFVTLPQYAIRAAKVLPLSNAMYVTVLPVVRPDERRQWEHYASENDYWVNETINLQEEWDGYYGPAISEWRTLDVVHDPFETTLPYNLSRNYLPCWQAFPCIPHEYTAYNYDWFSTTDSSATERAMANHRAVISETYLLPTPDDADATAESELTADLYSAYIPDPTKSTEPVADFYYPIINDLSKINVAGTNDYDAAEHDLVGLLAAPFQWRAMIEGNLPSDSKGIVVLFDSPCNSPFSYEINGTNVDYLGTGDTRGRVYQHGNLETARNLSDLRGFATNNAAYSGAPLDVEFCPITMRLFPSITMKDEFLTQSPLAYAIGALAIFVFTSLVFALYDAFVERRQRVVLTSATQSSAIVSSLFPSQVRDQLYPMRSIVIETAKGRGQGLSSETQEDCLDSKVHAKPVGSPIAELYKETTVYFADIAGFTLWSASRSPTQVFQLLETLYGAFDEIADRLGVFKVETIGDCYVAVVGLPTPRKHHAVVMARFAQECMAAMKDITRDLEQSLGVGTQDLAMRVGLNSGETTAGVLRGAKARFQLFGDTVNTAARMESNGERNRIQVSQVTADLIKQAGKRHWLTARRDKIVAKGKGEMQTYWCDPLAIKGRLAENSSATDERESESRLAAPAHQRTSAPSAGSPNKEE